MTLRVLGVVALIACSPFIVAGQQPPPAAPAGVVAPDQNLPPHIRKLTGFGERAEFSLDSKRVLFLSKTFGDAILITNVKDPKSLCKLDQAGSPTIVSDAP